MSMLYSAGAPLVVVYEASGTITKGAPVKLGTPTTEANPVPSLDVTRYIPTVVEVAASEDIEFIGAAIESAASGEKVKVCIQGTCQGAFGIGTELTAGDQVDIEASAGNFGEATTSTEQVVAQALETVTTTADDELVWIYIPPRTIGLGGG